MTREPKFNLVFAGHDDGAQMAEYARIVWAETIAELQAYGALDTAQRSRFATVERYCRYRAEFHFLYPVCASQGPVRQGENGEYVSLSWAMLGKLEEKLSRFDDMFWRWCGGRTEKRTSKPSIPAPAEKYLKRASFS